MFVENGCIDQDQYYFVDYFCVFVGYCVECLVEYGVEGDYGYGGQVDGVSGEEDVDVDEGQVDVYCQCVDVGGQCCYCENLE